MQNMNKCKCISSKKLIVEVMEAIIAIVIMTTLAFMFYSLIKPEEVKSMKFNIADSTPYCISEQKNITKDDVKIEIVRQSLEADVNIYTALKIANSESNYDHLAKNKNSSASGVFQITRSTFLEGIKKMKVDWVESDVFDYKKNIQMSVWMIKKGELWRWNASKKSWSK